MARATGFTCDNCGRFEIGGTANVQAVPPPGWFRLYPQVEADKDIKENEGGRVDLCGAECVAQYAATRVMEEAGTLTYSFNADSQRGPRVRTSRGPRKKGEG